MSKTPPKKKNPADLTPRNEGHLKKEIAKVNRRIRALVTRIEAIEYQLAGGK